MADMKILILITEAHGNNLSAMFSAPCIDMCILQKVITHLAFISGENHSSTLFVISKYFFKTNRDISFSRSLSRN